MKSYFIFPLKFSNFLKSFFHQDKYGNNFTQKWNTDKRNINYLLSRSELSMYLIARWYKENNNIDPTIWLPEYFCDQSTKYLSDNGFKIHYYKIKNNLEPDWEYCYKKAETVEPNIFFLVHYFGNCSDVEETLIFCKKHKSIFVEDCAHVLYPNNRIGIHGDFMIYSPHKFVSIPNGAILVQRQLFKKSVALEDIIDSIPNKYFSAIPWALKNIFKKYIPRFILLLVKNPKEKTKNNFNINSKKIELLMHPVSKSLIKVFSKKIENIGLYRILNFQIFDRIYGNENVTTNSSFDIPYLYTIKYEDVTESKKQYDNFKKNKFDVMKWPDLPQEVIDLKNYSEINELYNRSIFLGIDTNPLKLLKILKPFSKYDYKIEKNESASFIEKMAIKASRPNLIQTLGYSHANIRKKIRTSSYVVYKNQKAISLFFVSIKKFLLAKIIYINRGPLFLENIDDLDKLMIMKSLKRKFKIFKGSLLLISPNLLDTKKNRELMRLSGFKLFRRKAYSSIRIDLRLSIENLRANLNGKWRNQLKRSEKNELDLSVTQDHESFDFLMKEYQNMMYTKSFIGPKVDMYHSLYKSDPEKLFTLKAYNGKDCIGSILIVAHGNTCSYQVGWNSDEGRKNYANNFLLWNGIVEMKKKGFQYFDLGGINEIKTPGITKFKRGLGGREYKLLDQYFSFI